MKAATLRAFKQPLEWQEVSTPSPEPDEVLVQVMACGIDGTDLKLLDGFGYTPDLPFIMGHEVAGVVTEAGYRVTGFEEGDRVIAYNFTTCGECLPCRTYREQICVNMGGVLGAKDRHGGYAEYVAIPGRPVGTFAGAGRVAGRRGLLRRRHDGLSRHRSSQAARG